MKRGDVYQANLDPVIGSEQGGIRPVVIIQNDRGNRYSPTVIVVAVTTRRTSDTNSHLKHGIRPASFPPRLCFVPLARTSSTPCFTQLCRNEKSAMLDAMF